MSSPVSQTFEQEDRSWSAGFPGGSVSKESVYSAGDPGSIPGWGRETATHSSVIAWEIPWTEEPGQLQSIGSQRDSAIIPPPPNRT